IDPNTQITDSSTAFWSSSARAGDGDATMWNVFFNLAGVVQPVSASSVATTRCVRVDHVVSNASGYTVSAATVIDPRTQLTWQRMIDTDQSADWMGAQQYCQALD